MTNELPLFRLGDYCRKIGSGATPRGGKDAYLPSGPFSLIRSQNVYNDRFSVSGLAYISQDQANALKAVEVLAGDVLVNITGDSVARVCQVDPSVLPARVNQHVAIVRPDNENIDAGFLRYWFVTRETQNSLLALASAGATRPALTKSMLENLEVPRIDINDQRAIASVLAALDDKIELNRRMNETLEGMAQAIFRDWFVDFGPVRRKAAGEADPVATMGGLTPDPARAAELAALFPAAIGNDSLPVGWALTSVGQLVDFNPRESLPKGLPAPYSDMSSLPTSGAIANNPVMREFSSGMKFRNGDALLARITPCLENGKAAFVDYLPDENPVGWGSTEFIVMRSRHPVPKEFAYLLTRWPDFRASAIQSMTGTSGRQRASAETLAQFSFIHAPDAVWTEFGRILEPMFKKISQAGVENAALAETRDYLLPRLMSGAVRVAPQVEAA